MTNFTPAIQNLWMQSKQFIVTLALFLITVTSLNAQTLAGWNFNAKGGQSSVAATTLASGVSGNSSLGSGLVAINYLSNGLTGRDQTQTTLANAITNNEYISFTITPASGKSVSITSVKFRPISQNRARSFSVFSSRNGFAAANVISTTSHNGNQWLALQTVNISSHTNITTATEFRIYIYGYTDQWESAGLGNRQSGLSEDDLIITGTVQDVATSNLNVSPSSLSFSASAGSSPVSVTSNVSWSVTDNQSWISVSPTSGSNNGTVTVSVTANGGTTSRTGTVTITGASITRTVSVSQAGTSSGANATVNLNSNTTFQTMDGFGFFGARDVWWNSSDPNYFYNTAWLDRVIGDLGISIWRNELYPHIPPTSNTTPNQDAYWDKVRPTAQALKAKADQFGVNLKIVLTVWSPPGSYKWWSQFSWPGDAAAQRGPSGEGDYWSEKNGGTLNPNRYSQYATWLVQGVQMYKDAGLNVYALSPQNEPAFAQTFNSCTYTTFWYKDMINAVIPTVKAAHPGLKIFGSENMLEMEGASNNYPWFYTQALKDNAAATSNIDILAYHGYSDGVNPSSGSNLASYWTNTLQQFAQPMGKKQWMTETSGYLDSWEGSGGTPGAFNLALDMFSALYYGNVSGWVWWQGSDTNATTNEFALFSNTIGKKYYVSKQFYRYVRPDAVRVFSSTTDANIYAVAFRNSRINTSTIVLMNANTASRTINLSTTGSGWPTSYEMFVSSPTQNCVSTGTVSSSSVITLPARSVVTLQAGGTAMLMAAQPEEKADVRVFPNPTSNQLKLYAKSDSNEELKVTIRDQANQTLINTSYTLQEGENELAIDISKLKPGMYMLTTQQGNKKVSQRIVKE
jgi:glucuronoarabinoxylan endo-1,4-beta-xylanase